MVRFGTVAEMLIVMLSLPFALVGGVWAMWLLDYNLSIAVAVGFIALAGVAAETGVVMLLYLDHAWDDITRDGRRPTRADLVRAIEYGAVNRLRPKLMTVAAIMLGFAERTLRKQVAMGRVPPPLRFGRVIRWRRTDLEAWAELGCPTAERFAEWQRVNGGAAASANPPRPRRPQWPRQTRRAAIRCPNTARRRRQ